MKVPRIIIAAPSSGQGKTTFSMGLMSALVKRNLKVQPYKVGPDYIDPAFHTAITGRNSINLDSWMLDERYIKNLLTTYSRDADISVIEGVMGLYDGVGDNPLSGSTAGISIMLNTPVAIVMQAGGMSATSAAILHGLRSFGNVNIVGVIINKPSSMNHYNAVKHAIEKHTGIKVLGSIPKTESIQLKSRHLGLVQYCETEEALQIIEQLADIIESSVDIDEILNIANACTEHYGSDLEESMAKGKVKIAVAKDAAFNFYYYENLRILERMGAVLEFFSPISDDALPEGVCGVYIGGGYPEEFASQLHDNASIRKDIYTKACNGLPIFAECGGYMYLNNGITDEAGIKYNFTGIFNGEAYMTDKLQNFGYSEAVFSEDACFAEEGLRIPVHEFHKSVLIRNGEKACVQLSKVRHGQQEQWSCGMCRDNVLGMYPHVYFPSCMELAEGFFRQCIVYDKNILSSDIELK